MKPPRPSQTPPPPNEPKTATVHYLNSPDWPERYWTCITPLLPELKEERAAIDEPPEAA
jgi:hypothetical protein